MQTRRGESKEGEKVHNSAKGVVPLKLNLQLDSDKSVISVAVGRRGWAFGGHYKLRPDFSGLLDHLLHLPLYLSCPSSDGFGTVLSTVNLSKVSWLVQSPL